MKQWEIPVTRQACSTVTIEADTLEEAMEIARTMKNNDYKNRSIEEILVAFAESMPSCSECPLDWFCNRSEEGQRYGTCAGSVIAWFKTQETQNNKTRK